MEEPALPNDLFIYFSSFFNLNRERGNNGFTPLSLNLLQIKEELMLNDLYDSDGVQYIRALDDEYLAWVHINYYSKDKGKKA